MTGSPIKRQRRQRFDALVADEQPTMDSICATVTGGTGLRTWCFAQNVNYSSVLGWIRRDPARANAYDEARALGAHALVEESLSILDTAPERKQDGSIDAAGVALMKHRSDARRWLAGRLLPGMYSDSINVTGNHTVMLDIRALLETREQRLREISALTESDDPYRLIAGHTRAPDVVEAEPEHDFSTNP